jgi:hypothetical protein
MMPHRLAAFFALMLMPPSAAGLLLPPSASTRVAPRALHRGVRQRAAVMFQDDFRDPAWQRDSILLLCFCGLEE